MPDAISRRLSKDRRQAQLVFTETTVDVDALKAIISALGELRSAMLPEEPGEFVPPQPVLAISDPPWTAEPEQFDECILLHLRDPRFGWLSYSLPKSSAAKLGTHLLTLARAKTPATKPN